MAVLRISQEHLSQVTVNLTLGLMQGWHLTHPWTDLAPIAGHLRRTEQLNWRLDSDERRRPLREQETLRERSRPLRERRSHSENEGATQRTKEPLREQGAIQRTNERATQGTGNHSEISKTRRPSKEPKEFLKDRPEIRTNRGFRVKWDFYT